MQSSFELLQRAAALNDDRLKALIAEEVVSFDPDNLAALEVLALARWRIGDFESAFSAAGRAIALNPAESAYAFIRGDCLQQMQRFPEAALEFGRCCAESSGSLCAQASMKLREVTQIQESLAAELIRYDPSLAAKVACAPYETLKTLGFSFPAVTTHEPIPALSPQVQWARPS
jgi:tetratricopeptide (TPR) repeat protein